MTPREKKIYYHAQLESLRRCKEHLMSSMKLIEFEILSCEREIEHSNHTDIPKERNPEDRIAFLESANYKPEY